MSETSPETLSARELAQLVLRVFQPRATEKSIAFLVDLPDNVVADTAPWKRRRHMAAQWAKHLCELHERASSADSFALEVHLFVYRNAHTNNGDLPEFAWKLDPHTAAEKMPDSVDAMGDTPCVSFHDLFGAHPIFIAPTQFSATAPLKLAAPQFGFRAATMPGFSDAMIPALRLDYDKINRRVLRLKALLDAATSATCEFVVDSAEADGHAETHHLTLDLRHRTAHASGGVFPQPGQAGNVPSGETYIVPYEGEHAGDPSRSEGTLAVQLGNDIVLYRISGNKAVQVLNQDASPTAQREAQMIATEPAYANLAELGLGVLGDFGLEPTGEVLLDEKLGLHIAFGRSDHFGGTVGPKAFSRPDAVVHIDRVYVPKLQPRVNVRAVDLRMSDGSTVELMRDGKYVVDFAD